MKRLQRVPRDGFTNPVVARALAGEWFVGGRDAQRFRTGEPPAAFVREESPARQEVCGMARLAADETLHLICHRGEDPRRALLRDPVLQRILEGEVVGSTDLAQAIGEPLYELGGLAAFGDGLVFEAQTLERAGVYAVRGDGSVERVHSLPRQERAELAVAGTSLFWLAWSGALSVLGAAFEMAGTLARTTQGPAAPFAAGRGCFAVGHDQLEVWRLEGAQWSKTSAAPLARVVLPSFIAAHESGACVALGSAKYVDLYGADGAQLASLPTRGGNVLALAIDSSTHQLLVVCPKHTSVYSLAQWVG